MSVTAGALSQISVGSNTAKLQSAAATGGTGPYTYQWYRSTTTGFSPGGGNILTGKTSLDLDDSGLIPNTIYYYKVIATDTGDSNTTSTSSQLAVTTTAQQLSPNQFAQTPVLGMIDLRFDYDTVAVQIDSSQVTALYAGSAVKIVDSAGGVPKVIGCDADEDEVFGFINFDIKTVQFLANMAAEISQTGNVMFLYAGGAIARGVRVVLQDPAISPGTVLAATGSTGSRIVGFAYDKAAAAGELIRVKLDCPSFELD